MVAKVDDAELTQDDLDEMLNNQVVQQAMQTSQPDGDNASMTEAEKVISLWIILEAAQAAGVAELDATRRRTPCCRRSPATTRRSSTRRAASPRT